VADSPGKDNRGTQSLMQGGQRWRANGTQYEKTRAVPPLGLLLLPPQDTQQHHWVTSTTKSLKRQKRLFKEHQHCNRSRTVQVICALEPHILLPHTLSHSTSQQNRGRREGKATHRERNDMTTSETSGYLLGNRARNTFDNIRVQCSTL
jgi:hypothetical protein